MLVGVVVALMSSLMVAAVSAQQPSVPPNRFFGSVTLDGASAPASTVVAATIGGVVCGEVTVATAGSYSRLDVVDSAGTAGCGTAGATVEFLVGGNPAAETATWASGSFTDLALTGVSTAVVPPPVVEPPVAPPVVVTATPVIVTGSGGYLDGGSGTAWSAYMAGGLALLLLTTAGAVAYRRLRP